MSRLRSIGTLNDHVPLRQMFAMRLPCSSPGRGSGRAWQDLLHRLANRLAPSMSATWSPSFGCAGADLKSTGASSWTWPACRGKHRRPFTSLEGTDIQDASSRQSPQSCAYRRGSRCENPFQVSAHDSMRGLHPRSMSPREHLRGAARCYFCASVSPRSWAQAAAAMVRRCIATTQSQW